MKNSCEDNGINLPANLELLPDLTSAYINSPHGGNALYYFHANHLGSGSMITSAWGHPCQTLAYAPHGEILLDHKYLGYEYYAKHLFGGYERDPESGMDYAHDRYRDINLGFISSDRHYFNYPHQSNYSYCGNSPIMRIDPSGMDDYINEEGKKVYSDGRTTNNLRTLSNKNWS